MRLYKLMLMKLDHKGQTVAEYVLVAVLIVMALWGAFQAANIGNAVGSQAEQIQDHVGNPE